MLRPKIDGSTRIRLRLGPPPLDRRRVRERRQCLAPSDEVARTALDAALKTWRDGGKPGTVAGTDPPVEVHDTPWGQGDRLASYEILGEEAGTRREAVHRPPGPREARAHRGGEVSRARPAAR